MIDKENYSVKRIVLLILLISSSLHSLPTVVPEPNKCIAQLERNFFNNHVVSEALSYYNIRQELWDLIVKDLAKRTETIPARMKRKTAFMVPNPIEFPIQNEVAAKILRDVFWEAYLETMVAFQLNIEPTVSYIFDYILTENIPVFVQCFGPEAATLQPNFQ